MQFSVKILSGTSYLLKNRLKAFVHFPASQRDTNSKQVKIKVQGLQIFSEDRK